MPKPLTPEEFLQALQELDPNVSRETMAALEAYAANLLKKEASDTFGVTLSYRY